MRNRTRGLGWPLLLVLAAAAMPQRVQAQAAETEEAAVRQVVEGYFVALKNRDIEALKKLIHPRTIFTSVNREGQLDEMSQERWHDMIKPTEANAAPYEMTGSMQSVDIVDSTASVKSTVEFPRYLFREYISLLKIEGRWMIVHKAYVLKGKPR